MVKKINQRETVYMIDSQLFEHIKGGVSVNLIEFAGLYG